MRRAVKNLLVGKSIIITSIYKAINSFTDKFNLSNYLLIFVHLF